MKITPHVYRVLYTYGGEESSSRRVLLNKIENVHVCTIENMYSMYLVSYNGRLVHIIEA